MTALTQTEAELHEARQQILLLAEMLRFLLSGMSARQHTEFRRQYPEAREVLANATKVSEVTNEQTD